jgi:hypothetical protein
MTRSLLSHNVAQGANVQSISRGIELHHPNLCSEDVLGVEVSCRSVLDLEPEPRLRRQAAMSD